AFGSIPIPIVQKRIALPVLRRMRACCSQLITRGRRRWQVPEQTGNRRMLRLPITMELRELRCDWRGLQRCDSERLDTYTEFRNHVSRAKCIFDLEHCGAIDAGASAREYGGEPEPDISRLRGAFGRAGEYSSARFCSGNG